MEKNYKPYHIQCFAAKGYEVPNYTSEFEDLEEAIEEAVDICMAERVVCMVCEVKQLTGNRYHKVMVDTSGNVYNHA